MEISESKLLPHHRTEGTRPNDLQVENFLRQTGEYTTPGGEGPVIFAEPDKELRKLVWRNPEEVGESYVRAFERYKTLWRDLVRSIPRAELPPPKSLARIIRDAIQPPALANRVASRLVTGKEPYPFKRGVQQWRIDAKKDHTLLLQLIQENAEQMDEMRDLPVYERPGKQSRQCAHEGCSLAPKLRPDGSGRYYIYCHLHGVRSANLEASEGPRDDIEETLDRISDVEMENFELSDETSDYSEVQETTIEPFEDDLEITTTIY